MTSLGYQTTVAECTSALKLGFRFRVYGLGLRVSKRLRLFSGACGIASAVFLVVPFLFSTHFTSLRG